MRLFGGGRADIDPLAGSAGAVAAAVALAAYVALHWTGTGMIADSWAYWEGAISLATGHGYTYFSGNRIEAWPPLYSAYLAGWVLVAGPAGWVLTTATGLLVVLQAALWMRLLRLMAADSGLAVSRTAWLLLAAFVGLFLPVHERYPFSQSLVYVILPLFLEPVWRIVVRGEIDLAPRAAAIALLLPLIHASCLAFLGAASLLIAASNPRSLRHLVTAALISCLPVVAWMGARLALGQTGSHCIGLGVGRYDALSYVVQLFDGPGRAVVPDRFGVPVLGMVLLWFGTVWLALDSARAALVRFAALFCGVALVALYALFNLAWIYVPIGGRFVLFLPIVLVPAVCLTFAARAPRAGTALLLLLLAPQVYWLGIWTLEQSTRDRLFAVQPTAFLPHDAYASHDHRQGPPVRRDNRLLVAPDPEAQTDGRCH